MDYEYEQDRHLRTLRKQAAKAQQEAYDAALALDKCNRQRRFYLAVNGIITVLAILMAAWTASLCGVLQ